MELPVVRSRASLDPIWGLLQDIGFKVTSRKATKLRFVWYVGEVEDVVVSSGVGELFEELALVDSFVPWPQIRGVEVDLKLS